MGDAHCHYVLWSANDSSVAEMLPNSCLTVAMALSIFRNLEIPNSTVMNPHGMQSNPMAANHPSCEKWIIDIPAINKATPDRRYDRSVRSFANSVRSMAS